MKLETLLKKVSRSCKHVRLVDMGTADQSCKATHSYECVFRRISDSDSDSIRTGIRFISDAVPI